MSQRQRTWVTLGVLYGATLVFAMTTLLRNPIELTYVEDPTLYNMAKVGAIRDPQVFWTALRLFDSSESLVISEDVAETFSMSAEQLRLYTTINHYDLRPTVPPLIIDPSQVFDIHELVDGTELQLVASDQPSVHTYRSGDAIILIGPIE